MSPTLTKEKEMAYKHFYGFSTPKSSHRQILRMLVKQTGMDDDGLFYGDWIKELNDGDLLANLIKQIILRKDEPSIRPLFEEIMIEIEGIMDREIEDD